MFFLDFIVRSGIQVILNHHQGAGLCPRGDAQGLSNQGLYPPLSCSGFLMVDCTFTSCFLFLRGVMMSIVKVYNGYEYFTLIQFEPKNRKSFLLRLLKNRN